MASSFDSVQPNYCTEEMLDGWGRWSHEKNRLGYVSILGVMFDMYVGRMIDPHKRYLRRVSDDEAMRVNAALGKLLVRSPELYSLIEAVHRYNWSIEGISNRTGIKRHTVKAAYERAVGFVDGQLFEQIGVMVA